MRTTCIQQAASLGDKETPCCTGSLQFSSRENRKALTEFVASRRKKTSNRPPLCNQIQGYGVQQASSWQKFRGLISLLGPAGASRKISGLHKSGPQEGLGLALMSPQAMVLLPPRRGTGRAAPYVSQELTPSISGVEPS